MDAPSRDEIRSLCTEQSFERGVNYYQEDRVQNVDIDGGEIRATVRGSSYYDVAIDIVDDAIRTHCTCPYDYAGDCKHIVAVLLTVADRDGETEGTTADDTEGTLSANVDLDSLVADMTADELRSFLLDVVADEPGIRDRLLAYAGADTGKTVYDYKQEIDRLFDDATGRRGMVEHDTYIDFSQYHDLAQTHRDRGDIETATAIYRAIAEAIRENLNRVDDSGGHYGREIERAIDSYAETVVDGTASHDERRPHIEILCKGFIDAEHNFASDYYDDALRTLCTTDDDLEYWLSVLEDRVSYISLDTITTGESTPTTESTGEQTTEESTGEQATEETAPNDASAQHRERTDDVLYASDFTSGPLTTDDITGGTLDIEHPAVGPLQLGFFIGDSFEKLRLDDPTTVEAHTVDVDPAAPSGGNTELSSSLRIRSLVSMYRYILDALDRDAALSELYESVYLESPQLCQQYAERLLNEGNDERAIEVVEDGIETFRRTTDLRWLAADYYREREPDQYRQTLKTLFLDHSDWDAYDELKAHCDDQQWQSLYKEFEQRFPDSHTERIALYVHEGDPDAAFAELQASDQLSLFRQYREPVATVDPVEYFECYTELLVPFAAGETGRRHYRTVADHLEEMQPLVPEARFEAFVDELKDEHSNRPAFLDELETAGF